MKLKTKYLDECAVIQQNCTYTAEAHFLMATSARRKAVWFEVIPAIAAAVSSALVAIGVADTRLLPITIIAAVVSAVAGVLNPSKQYQDHLGAATSFTALKHDARFLRDAQAGTMTDDAFVIAVENLHKQYAEILKATPPTDEERFEAARKKVQAGIHEPDKDEQGKIK
jgi:hypothetical protein